MADDTAALPGAPIAPAGRATASPAAAAATSPRSPRLAFASGLLAPAALVLLWETVSRAGLVAAHALPPPSAVARTIAELAAGGELLRHAAVTAGRVAAGFLLGALAATALGVATAGSRRVRVLLDPLVHGLRAIPSLAWVPLFLLWLGIGEPSKVALIAVGAFFPVYLNLVAGIDALDRRLVEVGLVFRLRGLALVRRVVLPATLPAFVAGLRGGLGLAWMFVVAAELLGASRGLGFLMLDGQSTSRPELILASLVLFAALGRASDAGLEALAARASPGRVRRRAGLA